MSHLDPETCAWYRQRAAKDINRLVEKLRGDMTEIETMRTRAMIRALEALKDWKPESPLTDQEINFGL